ncbi:MAG: hypothetical protein K2Y32_10980 [Candidatus Obscuribacterales bacterium]|nr:hypothetical protein [Candidatus Obscuribacterales bacterium]
MGIFKSLLKKDKHNPRKLLSGVHFDMGNCENKINDENCLGFIDESNTCIMLRYNPAIDWDFDLRTPEKAFSFYEKQCREAQGVMLDGKVLKLDGVEALSGLFKYRAPYNPLAMVYVGIFWLPFQEGMIQVNIEGFETGTTGVRPAMITMLCQENGLPEEAYGNDDECESQSVDFSPPLQVASVEEMFERMKASPLRKILSDAEKWDSTLPDDPLSLVRRRMKLLESSINLSADIKVLTPYRV